MPAAEVKRIGASLDLKTVDVTMQYRRLAASVVEEEATLEALSCLPVTKLRFGEDFKLSAASLQLIGRLTRLTWLSLDFVGDTTQDLAKPLASALSNLRHLSTLHVCVDTQAPPIFAESSDSDVCRVIEAISSLPLLQTLWWCGATVTPLALVQLSTCKSLSNLTWWDGVDDFVLNIWAWGLTNLEALWVPNSPKVTNAALPTIAKVLTRLTQLNLSCTKVSNVGVAYLTSLRSLRELRVTETCVSPSLQMFPNGWTCDVVV